MSDKIFIAQVIEAELQKDGVNEKHAHRIGKRVAELLILLETARSHE